MKKILIIFIALAALFVAFFSGIKLFKKSNNIFVIGFWGMYCMEFDLGTTSTGSTLSQPLKFPFSGYSCLVHTNKIGESANVMIVNKKSGKTIAQKAIGKNIQDSLAVNNAQDPYLNTDDKILSDFYKGSKSCSCGGSCSGCNH